MRDLTRRSFLTRGSMGVALAGAAMAVPILSTAIKGGTTPGIAGVGSGAGEAFVVHVRDVGAGEMALLIGADQVLVRDRELALRLYAAARHGR